MVNRRDIVQFTSVAIVAAGIVIGVLQWLAPAIAVSPTPGIRSALLRVLTSMGAYFVALRLCLWLYAKMLWRAVNTASFLGGTWEYSFNNTVDIATGLPAEPDRKGEVRIVHTPEILSFHGESHGRTLGVTPPAPSSGASTLWESTSSAVNGERIDISISFRNRTGEGLGFAVLHVDTAARTGRWPLRSPSRITGRYIWLMSSAQDPIRGQVVFTRRAS